MIIRGIEVYRTTIGEYLSDPNKCKFSAGIYVIACYPCLGCLYVGISYDILLRLRQHLSSNKPLFEFMKMRFADAMGWRLDLIHVEDREKRRRLETKLIQYFRPQYNSHGLGETAGAKQEARPEPKRAVKWLQPAII